MNRYPFLNQLQNRELNTAYSAGELSLRNVAELQRRLDYPDRAYRVIHITGSKGKGSVATMFSSVLQEAETGLRVGLYTSPHVVSLEERIQINGEFIPESRLNAILEEKIRPEVEKMVRSGKSVSFFEALTLAAFVYFEEEKCDFAVIEAGMGGRTDATNICRPCLTVITNISLEHTAQLGMTLEAVAREKAGIIKRDTRLIVGAMPTETLEKVAPIIHGIAQTRHALDCWAGIHFPRATFPGVELGMPGEHQRQNAAIVAKSADLFRDFLTIKNVWEGLKKARLPGRLERVRTAPDMIFDAAHNPESVGASVLWLTETYFNRPISVLFACAQDKNWRKMLEMILQMNPERIIFTEFSASRAESCEKLAEFVPQSEDGMNIDVQIIPDPREALRVAETYLTPESVLLVTGSFFLLREIRGV